MTGVDVDEVVDLERLFEESEPCSFPPEWGGCDLPAEWACECRKCGVVTFLCTEHLQVLRATTRKMLLAVCSECRAVALFDLGRLWKWTRL